MRLNKKIAFYYLFFVFIILVSSSFTLKNEDYKDKPKVSYFTNSKIADGPYFFIQDDSSLVVKWIKGIRPVEREIKGNDFSKIEKKIGLDFDFISIDFNKKQQIDYKQEFTGVNKFIALSDIHGQLDLFVKLLKQYKVIDKDFNWIFGSNHLVIGGDVFDRGDKVTETFWLIYKLEKQAEEQGGKVHFILGNHELMVMNNDLRYVNDKYYKTTQILDIPYDQLYSKNTIIGRWLRSKPLMFSINEILFTHAGISPDFINKNLSIEKANYTFINSTVSDSIRVFLESGSGPLWYRGYFSEKGFDEKMLDSILSYFDKNHIVIGHTTLPNIVSFKNSKIIGIDSGIKDGVYGEVLYYEEGKFYRGTLNGTLIKL